jgi:hypothetical protein
VVWDPANALVAGENPFPDAYRMLPPDRIIHVHAKDCHVQDHTPEWGPLGTRAIDWKGQIAALLQDGYRSHISLETHWPGPGGNKLEASRICGWNLRGLASLSHGLASVSVEPLMHPELWTKPPDHPRYLVVARA